MAAITNSYRHLLWSVADLCAFVVVCRNGSITRAAKELGVSQPSLSKRIKNLEDTLQTKLFFRRSTGIELTGSGAALFQMAAEPLDTVAHQFDQRRRRTAPNRVLIAVDYAFASFWLLPRLPMLREHLGEIDLRVLASQDPLQESEVQPDISIFMAAKPDVGPEAHLLFPEAVSAVSSPQFLETAGPLTSANDLWDHQSKLLHLGSGSTAAPWFDWLEWLSHAGGRSGVLQKGATFNTYEMIIRAAVSGQGIALGWHSLIDDHIASGELVEVLPHVVTSGRGYFIKINHAAPRKGSITSRVQDWIVSESGTS
ncbi:LysR family transcriptional regulator [Sulfitobacter mediterraneus]|uniref:LysR family transcriptional regulator n=1 Tax=Sulfitobacter mediterraneus TaxID=83219 RepID=UPI000EA16E96|nr:LysR family transcriptional regulator [Sulfitobacter mediterraneus]